MLKYNEEFDKLRTKVIKYVLYKKRTEKEIRDKFINENQEYINEIIDFLIEDKYINDIEYIDAYFTESKILKKRSIKEIEFKLLEKGINRENIQIYIKNNEENLKKYEINSALNLLNKRNDKEVNKNISYLLIKGYTIENIRKAIEKLEEK